MRIHATFIAPVKHPDEIELVHAWDEYCVDNNPEGYAETRAEELARYSDQVYAHVTVDLEVDGAAIRKALFENPVVRTPVQPSTV